METSTQHIGFAVFTKIAVNNRSQLARVVRPPGKLPRGRLVGAHLPPIKKPRTELISEKLICILYHPGFYQLYQLSVTTQELLLFGTRDSVWAQVTRSLPRKPKALTKSAHEARFIVVLLSSSWLS